MNTVSFRMMSTRDMDDVMRIEHQCFPIPWHLRDFNLTIKCRNTEGLVAVVHGEVVGYCVYQLFKKRLHIINFAVAPEFWRHGIGRVMAEKIVGKLHPDRRTHATAEVRETNLQAQLFWKAMGFRWVGTLKENYDYTDEDCYLMEISVGCLETA
jgi:ribosomal-protein-alanine N-acetyltransferase